MKYFEKELTEKEYENISKHENFNFCQHNWIKISYIFWCEHCGTVKDERRKYPYNSRSDSNDNTRIIKYWIPEQSAKAEEG